MVETILAMSAVSVTIVRVRKQPDAQHVNVRMDSFEPSESRLQGWEVFHF